MYTNRSLAALLLCLPAAANFYIVVSQDVVTVGVVTVVLEMHACVGRDQHLCCLLFPPKQSQLFERGGIYGIDDACKIEAVQ